MKLQFVTCTPAGSWPSARPVPAISDGVASLFRGSGIDLRALRLTDEDLWRVDRAPRGTAEGGADPLCDAVHPGGIREDQARARCQATPATVCRSRFGTVVARLAIALC